LKSNTLEQGSWFACAVIAVVCTGGVASGFAADTETLVQEVERKHSIQVLYLTPRFPVKTPYGPIEGSAASRESVNRYAPVLFEELRLYPPALIRRLGLRQVILCERLAFKGQLRAAIPGFQNRDLYLDVSRGAHSRRYQRQALAHELFHLIDFVDDGEVYRDAGWSSLNPPSFQYGSGGSNAQEDKRMSLRSKTTPGFVSLYAMTGVEEDKAELFAALVMDQEFVRRQQRSDRVLAAKVVRLKAIMVAFCPEVDERFWDRARDLRRD
jgi:hypothetical protein